MSDRHSDILLSDMLDSIAAILDYSAGMDFDAFLLDRKTRDAVIRNLQVLGEAANRVPK